MASNKQQKVNKDIAEMILRINGHDYNDWLDERHIEVISKGSDTIKKLSTMAVTKNNFVTENSNEEKETFEGGES